MFFSDKYETHVTNVTNLLFLGSCVRTILMKALCNVGLFYGIKMETALILSIKIGTRCWLAESGKR